MSPEQAETDSLEHFDPSNGEHRELVRRIADILYGTRLYGLSYTPRRVTIEEINKFITWYKANGSDGTFEFYEDELESMSSFLKSENPSQKLFLDEVQSELGKKENIPLQW